MPAHFKLKLNVSVYMGFSGDSVVKNLPVNAGDVGFDPWVGKIPWRRKWQYSQYSCHGQRSLMGYSIWGRKRVGQQLNNNNLFICQKIAVSWTEVFCKSYHHSLSTHS